MRASEVHIYIYIIFGMAQLAFASPLPFKAVSKRRRSSTAHTPICAQLKVAIAGGGLGGLVLACNLVRHGVQVRCFEKAEAYRKFGGPIQLQSNCLSMLREIDPELLHSVCQLGSVTGNRHGAVVDGLTGKHLTEFDTGKSARRNGLPLTHIIERPLLQQVLLEYVQKLSPGSVVNGTPVVGYSAADYGQGIHVNLKGGQVSERFDVLVGADGIWSAVRAAMHNTGDIRHGARYSGYRCYTATCDYVCEDRAKIAYKIVLGNAAYFVCSDVGRDRVQWYAFVSSKGEHSDDMGSLLETVRRRFSGWGAEICPILDATHENDVEARDIYDRPPLMSGWSDNQQPVVLLGDSAHAILPNLGQGGGMAIEDAYFLANALVKHHPPRQALTRYEKQRFLRTSIVHGLSRMSSDVLRVYGADSQYFGWGIFWNTIGPAVLGTSMPLVLEYLYINLLGKKEGDQVLGNK